MKVQMVTVHPNLLKHLQDLAAGVSRVQADFDHAAAVAAMGAGVENFKGKIRVTELGLLLESDDQPIGAGTSQTEVQPTL